MGSLEIVNIVIAIMVVILVAIRIVVVDGRNDVSMHVGMKDGLWRCYSWASGPVSRVCFVAWGFGCSVLGPV